MHAEQPNVLVFFTDQQRWDTAGVHGCPLDLMPNFDRIAQEGTHLQHCFTPQPVCGPARACLQTGRYATQTGCFTNSRPLPAGTQTLAHHFRAGGYATAYIGKWHLAGQNPVPEERRGGYEYWLAANVLEMTSDAYRTRMWDHENRPVDLPGYRVDALTDAVIRYLAAPKERPFFLFVSYIEPHFQNSRDDYPAPEGYAERYQGRWMPPDLLALQGSAQGHWGGYCGMIKRLDEALGRILEALHSLGLRRKTNLLFTSDHGCHFKTRNSEYKRSGHDSSIRVPAAFTGPAFDGGGRIQELISLVDLPPTLLDCAGLPLSQELAGRSLLPLLRRERADWPEEVFVQISEAQVGRAVRTRRWKYGVHAPDKDPRKDAGSERYAEEYLFDLYADPYELRNLIGHESHRGVCAVMRERLLRRMRHAGEAPPQIEAAASKPAGQFELLPGEERE